MGPFGRLQEKNWYIAYVVSDQCMHFLIDNDGTLLSISNQIITALGWFFDIFKIL